MINSTNKKLNTGDQVYIITSNDNKFSLVLGKVVALPAPVGGGLVYKISSGDLIVDRFEDQIFTDRTQAIKVLNEYQKSLDISYSTDDAIEGGLKDVYHHYLDEGIENPVVTEKVDKRVIIKDSCFKEIQIYNNKVLVRVAILKGIVIINWSRA